MSFRRSRRTTFDYEGDDAADSRGILRDLGLRLDLGLERKGHIRTFTIVDSLTLHLCTFAPCISGINGPELMGV